MVAEAEPTDQWSRITMARLVSPIVLDAGEARFRREWKSSHLETKLFYQVAASEKYSIPHTRLHNEALECGREVGNANEAMKDLVSPDQSFHFRNVEAR